MALIILILMTYIEDYGRRKYSSRTIADFNSRSK